jgi:Ribbon-helix-helix protein, copG family.
MSSKVMLTARLERELVEKINRIARQKDVSVNDLIDQAIGLVERQHREADSLVDRVFVLEKNMLALYDLIAVFGERMDGKFSEASINEKERLEYLYALVEKRIVEHDKAEVGRFEKTFPHPQGTYY